MRKLRPGSQSKRLRQGSEPGLPESGVTFMTILPRPAPQVSGLQLLSKVHPRAGSSAQGSPLPPTTKKPFPILMSFFIFVDYVIGNGTKRRQGSWPELTGREAGPHPSHSTPYSLLSTRPPPAEPRGGPAGLRQTIPLFSSLTSLPW